MAENLYESALAHKGICEQYGRIQTKEIWSEANGTEKIVRIVPQYKEITCLADFFAILKEIHTEHEKSKTGDEKKWKSLFLYRGQGNVNFTYTPSIVRRRNDLEREHLLCKELHRRFYESFDRCKYMMEEETLMQHFGLGSRCMDLPENPLMALWVACESDSDKSFEHTFGELSIWCLDDYWEDLKAFDSSTVSVIANTAIQSDCFLLGDLERAYLKEQPTSRHDFIYLKDVLRRTAIVLPKYNNQRIEKQRTVFAVMNLCEFVDTDYRFKKKFGVSAQKFTQYILNAEVTNAGKSVEYRYPNVERLRKNLHTLQGADFSELTSWDLVFKKLTPSEVPYTDTFDLYRYLYKGKNATAQEWHPVTIIVPPQHKKAIEKELEYLGITKSFIFPEMEKVASELKATYGLET